MQRGLGFTHAFLIIPTSNGQELEWSDMRDHGYGEPESLNRHHRAPFHYLLPLLYLPPSMSLYGTATVDH